VFVVGATDCVPDVALAPVQPPLAVQLVSFVDDHVIVEDWPEVVDVGEAEMVAVGEGVGDEITALIIPLATFESPPNIALRLSVPRNDTS
jgi:hypothetical protein